MDNKDQVKGKIKQAAADLTGNAALKREGKADEKAGDLKATVHDAGEKMKDLIDAAKDKLTRD